MDLGVPVRPIVEKKSGNKHVESLKTHRLDERSSRSDSTFALRSPIIFWMTAQGFLVLRLNILYI